MNINKVTFNFIKDLALNGNAVFDADYSKKSHVQAVDFFEKAGFNVIRCATFIKLDSGKETGACIEIQSLK